MVLIEEINFRYFKLRISIFFSDFEGLLTTRIHWLDLIQVLGMLNSRKRYLLDQFMMNPMIFLLAIQKSGLII